MSAHLFLSSANGTIFETNVVVDHPQNRIVQLEPSPIIDHHFILSVMPLHMKTRKKTIRYDAVAWFRDEEVLNIKSEEVIFEAGRWTQLGVIDLSEELPELETEDGILILPGAEELLTTRSYLRVSINFAEVDRSIAVGTDHHEHDHSGENDGVVDTADAQVQVGEEDEETRIIVPRRSAVFIRWGLWTLLGFAIQTFTGRTAL